MSQHLTRTFALAAISIPMALAQQPTAPPTSSIQTNSSHIDAGGTAHITRVVPVPKTISPQAQAGLARPASDAATHETLAQRRTGTDAWQTRAGEASLAAFPVHIESRTIAGIPVRDITPLDPTPLHPGNVLINLHGGGFNSDSGSLTESIPIANLTHTRVVAVLYRLAPEHPFPAALDDAIAVYRELLKTYKPAHIAIYGTSAGAILSGHLDPPDTRPHDSEYTGSTDPRDPVLSPLYADLHGLPPTLFLTSGRDLLLSGTTLLHRAFLRANGDARLIVFEALTHAFWNDVNLPESHEAYGYMADFFSTHLNR